MLSKQKGWDQGKNNSQLKNVEEILLSMQISHLCIILENTVPTRPNLRLNGPKPDLGFAFGVRSGSAKANPERTPIGRKANPEQTQNEPRKRTPISETDP